MVDLFAQEVSIAVLVVMEAMLPRYRWAARLPDRSTLSGLFLVLLLRTPNLLSWTLSTLCRRLPLVFGHLLSLTRKHLLIRLAVQLMTMALLVPVKLVTW